MNIFDRIGLTELMSRTEGRSEVVIGLIDGPVLVNHPDFRPGALREISGKGTAACRRVESKACTHGTFVAGVLSGRRGAPAPSLCPGCTLLIRPIFGEGRDLGGGEAMPSCLPEELAGAIVDCIEAGARLLNLSVAAVRTAARVQRAVVDAIELATRRGALVFAAAGNQS
jgi:subtilisin family serine protease